MAFTDRTCAFIFFYINSSYPRNSSCTIHIYNFLIINLKQKIKIFDLQFDKKFRDKYQQGVKKILDQGFLTNHLFVKKFEKNFSSFTNNKYSVAVNSGT